MEREQKASVEIQAEVSRVLTEVLQAKGVQNVITVGPAKRLATADRDGCNWYLDHFTNARAHIVEVGVALADVRGRWNLERE